MKLMRAGPESRNKSDEMTFDTCAKILGNHVFSSFWGVFPLVTMSAVFLITFIYFVSIYCVPHMIKKCVVTMSMYVISLNVHVDM